LINTTTIKKLMCRHDSECKHNTNYYRRNKEQRFNVKKCPHCDYETTGPKSCLQAHIWAKHTPENERPFQCPCKGCDRGYSARANLNKHILKCHNIKMPKIDKKILIYEISLRDDKKININKSKLYKKNKFVIASQLPLKKLNIDMILFDEKKEIIDVKRHYRKDIIENLK